MAIIAAYSMADMEMATFGRGKDKKKRKKRGGLIAAGVAGGAAAIGAGAAGVRYGSAALKESRMKDTRFYGKDNKPIQAGTFGDKRRKAAVGAKSQLEKDKAGIGKAFGKAKQAGRNTITNVQMLANDAKGRAGEAFGKAKASAGRAKLALTGKQNFASKGALGRVKDVWKSGKVGKSGLVGAGLLGAGALAGAGYGAYKLANRNKKKRG